MAPQEDKDMINRLVLEEMGSSLVEMTKWGDLKNEEIGYPKGSWHNMRVLYGFIPQKTEKSEPKKIGENHHS